MQIREEAFGKRASRLSLIHGWRIILINPAGSLAVFGLTTSLCFIIGRCSNHSSVSSGIRDTGCAVSVSSQRIAIGLTTRQLTTAAAGHLKYRKK